MGRLIDCNDIYNAIQITADNFGVAKKVVEDNMLTMLSKIETVDAIPKSEYEARLKADLEAILVELQLEIHEIENPYPYDFDDLLPLAQHNAFYDAKSTIEDLVDERINAIKGDQEGEE